MNGPTRLSAGGSPLARQLIVAGRAERPRGEAKAETIAAATLITTGHTGLFLSFKKGWLAWLLVGLGLLGGGAGVVAGVRSSPSQSLSVDSVVVDRSTATVDVRPRVPDSFSADREASISTPSSTSAPSSTATPNLAPRAASLATEPPKPTELALVRRARIAIAKSDPASALEALDEHVTLYPKGALSEEAAALRVEALARSGHTNPARAAAARFARTYPESPYVERVRSIAASLPH